MKFQAHFVGEKDEFAVYLPGKEDFGLSFLDQAREKAGVKKLRLGIVHTSLQTYTSDPCMDVTEAFARRHQEIYAETSRPKINVPPRGLNKYVSVSPKVIESEETGEILKVEPEYRLNQEAVLADWENAGCPLKWEPEETEI